MRARCSSGGWPPATVAVYALVVLLVASLFSYLDRHLLSLVVPAVKQDLQISDTQVSLLQGFAFAALYSTASLPLGWAADRVNRRNLIIVGIVVWSLATIGCGLAASYMQLLVARMFVGVGEAALIPAAFSMIADYFAPERRGRALGVFSIGLFGGAGLAFLLGGAILSHFGSSTELALPLLGVTPVWKAAFLVVGAAGLIVPILLATVPEPVRRGAVPNGAPSTGGETLIGYAARHKAAFVTIWGGYTLLAVAAFGLSAWGATHLVRKFDVAMGEAGFLVGLSSLVGGVVGCLVGGRIGDRWVGAGNPGGRLRLLAVWWLGGTPALFGFALLPDTRLSAACFGLYFFFNAIGYVSAGAVIQDIVPPVLRGRATAVWLLLTGLVGQGLGPMLIALATDRAFGDDAALPLSLLVVGAPLALVGLPLSLAGQRYYDRLRGLSRTS